MKGHIIFQCRACERLSLSSKNSAPPVIIIGHPLLNYSSVWQKLNHNNNVLIVEVELVHT